MSELLHCHHSLKIIFKINIYKKNSAAYVKIDTLQSRLDGVHSYYIEQKVYK